MTLEASDVNDGAILQQTRQETAGNGAVRFSIDMPDGTPLQSEWISPEHRSKALMAWCETVRGQVASRAQAAAQAAAQVAREAALKAARSRMVEVVDTPPPGRPHFTAHGQVQDPLEHARSQLYLLEREVEHWEAEHGDAARKLNNARKARDKWAKIVEALSTNEEDSDT